MRPCTARGSRRVTTTKTNLEIEFLTDVKINGQIKQMFDGKVLTFNRGWKVDHLEAWFSGHGVVRFKCTVAGVPLRLPVGLGVRALKDLSANVRVLINPPFGEVLPPEPECEQPSLFPPAPGFHVLPLEGNTEELAKLLRGLGVYRISTDVQGARTDWKIELGLSVLSRLDTEVRFLIGPQLRVFPRPRIEVSDRILVNGRERNPNEIREWCEVWPGVAEIVIYRIEGIHFLGEES